MMAKKNSEVAVNIHVETTHRQENNIENYAEDFQGRLIKFNNAFYLRYIEKLPENDEEAKVTFKVEPSGIIQLTRKLSTHRLHLIFEIDKDHNSQYHTPFGNIPMKVVTQKIETQLVDEPSINGKINVDYQLFNGDLLVGDYKIRLQFNS